MIDQGNKKDQTPQAPHQEEEGRPNKVIEEEKPELRNHKRKHSEVHVNAHMMEDIFNRLDTKSKSPNNGFRLVKGKL